MLVGAILAATVIMAIPAIFLLSRDVIPCGVVVVMTMIMPVVVVMFVVVVMPVAVVMPMLVAVTVGALMASVGVVV